MPLIIDGYSDDTVIITRLYADGHRQDNTIGRYGRDVQITIGDRVVIDMAYAPDGGNGVSYAVWSATIRQAIQQGAHEGVEMPWGVSISTRHTGGLPTPVYALRCIADCPADTPFTVSTRAGWVLGEMPRWVAHARWAPWGGWREV